MKLSRLWRKKKPSPYGLFPWGGTWEEARASTTGYESEAIVKIIVDQHRAFLAEWDSPDFSVELRTQHFLFQLMAALAVIFWNHRPANFRVLDFGGSSGKYFYLLRRLFPQIQFDWLVIETEPMCKAHQVYEEKHLRWRSTFPEPSADALDKPFDLALASGCLMYPEKPYAILTELARLSRFLFVNRTPVLSIPEDRIVIQRIPPFLHETSHAHWLFSESKMLHFYSTIGKIRLKWDVPLDEKRIEDKPVHFKGFLVEMN